MIENTHAITWLDHQTNTENIHTIDWTGSYYDNKENIHSITWNMRRTSSNEHTLTWVEPGADNNVNIYPVTWVEPIASSSITYVVPFAAYDCFLKVQADIGT